MPHAVKLVNRIQPTSIEPNRFLLHFFVRDAFVKTNSSAIAMMFVRPSVCLSETGVHCDHTVHVSADFTYGWIVQCSGESGQPDTKVCPPTPSRLFYFHLKEGWSIKCAN